MEPPLVTVLTAVRNGQDHLVQAINSIRAQSVEDWEYLLVDDASEDDTADLVEEFEAQEPRIRLIRRSARGGPYVAANDGVRQARGRYLVRLDADDVALPQRIERQITYLATTGLSACGCDWQTMTTTGQPNRGTMTVRSGVRALKWRLCLRQGVAHSTLCVERSALDALGGYRELPMSQDLRVWCELARRDLVGMVPEVLVRVRRPGQMTHTSRARQEELALDVLGDHLSQLTGEEWSCESIRGLRPGGGGVGATEQLDSLERWESACRNDRRLSLSEHRELARLARRRRLEIARRELRQHPTSMSTFRTVISSGLGMIGPRT